MAGLWSIMESFGWAYRSRSQEWNYMAGVNKVRKKSFGLACRSRTDSLGKHRYLFSIPTSIPSHKETCE